MGRAGCTELSQTRPSPCLEGLGGYTAATAHMGDHPRGPRGKRQTRPRGQAAGTLRSQWLAQSQDCKFRGKRPLTESNDDTCSDTFWKLPLCQALSRTWSPGISLYGGVVPTEPDRNGSRDLEPSSPGRPTEPGFVSRWSRSRAQGLNRAPPRVPEGPHRKLACPGGSLTTPVHWGHSPLHPHEHQVECSSVHG